ncbi:uncharacterized protein PG986_007523 [Apiospora aurea]|uniref:Uncharacterized protein n=1 Tax=Apiospora aurea TaxID=335848 RepID=A0ABR1QE62_9PEZI
MFDENFTFDQKGVADTSRRDAVEPESAMSPKEVHADLPPPPPSFDATGKEAATTPAEPDTIDSLARQLGRQTLLQEDPQYQWRRSRQPFVAIRESLIETMIANNYQCNVQTSEPATPVSASLPSFFPPGGSCSSSSSGTTNLDGDTLMTDRNRSIQVDQDWGDDEPMVRLLSYRRAGAMTRVQKLGLSFRSAQHTALQCANLKPNKTRMRRRDRKPSKAQPTPAPTTMPAPPAVGASTT